MSYLLLDNFRVPGYGLQVSLSLKIKDEDASGETSGTAKAKKGTKGKKLEVKVNIRFTQAKELRELFRMAEAAAKGDNKKYAITNPTANAVGMRQGTFTGDLKVDKMDSLRAWAVSFTLGEHVSVPEMAESREKPKASTAPSSSGDKVEAPAPEAPKEENKLSYWEQKVKDANDALEKVGMGGEG